MSGEHRIIVIGGGPGGYVAAIEAAHLGAKVTLIEKDALGGTCVNRGCIPTKALVQTAGVMHEIGRAAEFGVLVDGYRLDYGRASERKARIVRQLRDGISLLMKKNRITVVKGTASLLDPDRVRVSGEEESCISGDRIIIATGSRPGPLAVAGVEDSNVIDSDEALALKSLPGRMAVIGGGVIGLEFAQIFRRMNVQVAVIERMPRILPAEDQDISRHLERALKKEGIDIYVDARVERIETTRPGSTSVRFTVNGVEQSVACEKVLLAVGRIPSTEDLGLDRAGIPLDRGFIPANDRMQTPVENIYAVGDAVGGAMLAHKAMAEGRCAAKNAMGIDSRMDYKAVPRCVWTCPEVAAVGLTESEARDRHGDVKVSVFPFAASGKARILGRTEGFVKIISENQYGEILGVHILGPHATEMIAESVLAIQAEIGFHGINETIHPHPTLSEAFLEASLGLEGKPLHIYP